MKYLKKDLEQKAIIWFRDSNNYLIFEQKTADIIADILDDKPLDTIAKTIAGELKVPFDEALGFVTNLNQNIVVNQTQAETTNKQSNQHQEFNVSYKYSCFYKIDAKTIHIEYQGDFELELVHPKFAYLEVKEAQELNLHLQIFKKDNLFFLTKNGSYYNHWTIENIHYLQGKVSMLLVETLYEKQEEQWMGVFHASALSNGYKSILFLGDSGYGKSTSLALLQGENYSCIADDFVPVSKEKKIYPFPSAISVKHTSWNLLSNYYPSLAFEKDYHFSSHNKTVKYIPPKNQNFSHIFDCNVWVFIKFVKDSNTLFAPLNKVEAFQKMLPDSWISNQPENVAAFLDWFSSIKCYSLTYSNNQEMFNLVSKLFTDVTK